MAGHPREAAGRPETPDVQLVRDRFLIFVSIIEILKAETARDRT